MSLLKKLATPLIAGSMAFTSLSLANSEESKINEGMSISKILGFVEKIKRTQPSHVSSGENEGKKGVCNAWDLNGDGNYNLIIFSDFYPGTIFETKDLIFGMPNSLPYLIFINIKDPENFDTRKGDIFLRRKSENGGYERAEYVEGKDI